MNSETPVSAEPQTHPALGVRILITYGVNGAGAVESCGGAVARYNALYGPWPRKEGEWKAIGSCDCAYCEPYCVSRKARLSA